MLKTLSAILVLGMALLIMASPPVFPSKATIKVPVLLDTPIGVLVEYWNIPSKLLLDNTLMCRYAGTPSRKIAVLECMAHDKDGVLGLYQTHIPVDGGKV